MNILIFLCCFGIYVIFLRILGFWSHFFSIGWFFSLFKDIFNLLINISEKKRFQVFFFCVLTLFHHILCVFVLVVALVVFSPASVSIKAQRFLVVNYCVLLNNVGRSHKTGRARVREDDEAPSWKKNISKLVYCFHMCHLLLLEISMVGSMTRQPAQKYRVKDPRWDNLYKRYCVRNSRWNDMYKKIFMVDYGFWSRSELEHELLST